MPRSESTKRGAEALNRPIDRVGRQPQRLRNKMLLSQNVVESARATSAAAAGGAGIVARQAICLFLLVIEMYTHYALPQLLLSCMLSVHQSVRACVREFFLHLGTKEKLKRFRAQVTSSWLLALWVVTLSQMLQIDRSIGNSHLFVESIATWACTRTFIVRQRSVSCQSHWNTDSAFWCI